MRTFGLCCVTKRMKRDTPRPKAGCGFGNPGHRASISLSTQPSQTNEQTQKEPPHLG